tara:strand:- start:385 stop:597 length:213 start_codon:yes stop_codon:yes gene_type:complete
MLLLMSGLVSVAIDFRLAPKYVVIQFQSAARLQMIMVKVTPVNVDLLIITELKVVLEGLEELEVQAALVE